LMADIGNVLFNFFEPLGPAGGLIFIFLLFYIDAILIPTLPELFVVLVFMGVESQSFEYLMGYAILMLIVIVAAEVLGVITLYLIIKKAGFGRFRPKIESAVESYRKFLLIQDERMILLNRIAPILPFMGAFIALSSWNLRRSIIYVVIGSITKYGVILALSGFFFAFFSQGVAQIATLAMVIAIIMLSLVASYVRRRRVENASRSA
jgi:hypothetical protein